MAGESRYGLAAALGAFGLWGLGPLYFKLLQTVRADEIIGHRVVWSAIFLFAVLLLRNRASILPHLRVRPAVLGALLLSGALLAVNWLIFVYAVNTDRVLETSLGYFINPLVSVVLGLLVLRESMSRLQGLAVGIAAAGTLYLALTAREFPWIALSLAFSFGLYGLVRKLTDVGPMVGLFWETLIMTPLALTWLVLLHGSGGLAFGNDSTAIDLLLVATGLVTAIPLVLFAVAARRLPLTTLGLMQYIAPSMSFCLAVFLFREPFTYGHAAAFGAIWTALAVYTWAGRYALRRSRIPV